MKWNKKFNYTPLSRIPVNGSRHYAVGQQRLPSVSTILSKTKSEEDKAALSAWIEKVGERESERIKKERPRKQQKRETETAGKRIERSQPRTWLVFERFCHDAR